jgi:hypothetical protein
MFLHFRALALIFGRGLLELVINSTKLFTMLFEKLIFRLFMLLFQFEQFLAM